MANVRYNLRDTFTAHEATLPTGKVPYFKGGEGPAYLHLHGAGGLRVTEGLHRLAQSFTIYMPLLPGFDGTPLHDEVNSFPELADLVGAFIDTVVGGPCDVSGQAFGGRLALWVAAQHPDKVGQLVVQCPSGFRPPGQTIPPPDQYTRGLFVYPDKVPDEPRSKEIVESNREAGYSYHAPGKGVVDRTVYRDEALVARLGEVECLTLVLQGTRDGALQPESVQFLKSRLPRAHLIYVHDAGHIIDIDQPERFAALVRDFLVRGQSFLVNPGDAAAGLDTRAA